MPLLARKPTKPSVITLADRARDAGQWKLAVGYYRTALSRNPQRSSIWIQYGHVLKESGQLPEAEKAYRTAISYDRQLADAYLHLGHVLKIQGKKEEARSAYVRAVALGPSLNGTSFEFSQLGWSAGQVSELQVMLGSRASRPNGCQAPEAPPASPSSRVLPADAQLIAGSGLFDPAWYRAQNPDLPTGMDPLTHYLTIGSAEGRRPNSLFDPTWYRAENPDIVVSGMEPLVHYIAYGCAEGRRPQRVTPQTIGQEVDPSYNRWVAEYDTLDDADRSAIRTHITQLARRPLISVVVPVYNAEEKYLREMIESVLQQIYPYWELCLADDASTKPHVEPVLREFAERDRRVKFTRRDTNGHIAAATNTALDLATGEFVALLDHDDLIAETALYEIAVELEAHPDADVIYSDSDNIDDSGQRSVPYFKTDWNPDLMLGHNMVSHLGVYRRALVEQIGRLRVGFEGSQDYDLMLRAADASVPGRIRHVPAVLYHWRRNAALSPSFSEKSLERCVVAARRAIREHLERNRVEARIDVLAKCPSWTRVIYSLPNERPLVSIIVPTRDRADLLARCADGVLTRTDYEPLELIIVDNDSTETETHQLFTRLARDPRVRIIQHPGSFNYAAINNRAVQESEGEVVVLMNNDVDVISPMWLEEMVSHALRPEIGAVGAKLLYSNGLVQHAGVVLGVGHGAGHFFAGASRDDIGRWGFLSLVRRVSAVTAACMALRRSVYLDVGGLDEINFPVVLNDVDFCLRIGKRGYGIVWTPHAELYHLESATRGPDTHGEQLARLDRAGEQLQSRWGEILSCDPFYNQNCSLTGPHFEPGFPPRRRKAWEDLEKRLYAAQATRSRGETHLAGINRSACVTETGPAPASFGKFELRTPSHQNALDIFEGKWASDFADVCPRSRAGQSPLFTLDTRPRDAARLLGINDRLDGMRVLELGPLEGAHTYQLEKLGSASILAIEANAEAFLKCLITKEITGLRAATFMHGDFSEYLKEGNERFDLVFCCGVLYHMADPLALIEAIAKITEKCYVWTHYYDIEHYRGAPREARSDPRYPGVRMYALEYNDMDSDRFWGGNRPISVWLERNDIVSAFRRVGFDKIDVIDEAPDHPNGACFSFAARRLVTTALGPTK